VFDLTGADLLRLTPKRLGLQSPPASTSLRGLIWDAARAAPVLIMTGLWLQK